MTLVRTLGALLCLGAMIVVPERAQAQDKPPVIVIPLTKRDSVRKDSLDKARAKAPVATRDRVNATSRDTINQLGRQRNLVTWDAPDSTMRELLDRKGYRQVHYQGDKVRFDAKNRLLLLNGVPAAVKRDQTELIGDSIVFDDSTKRIIAMGDSVTFRDPTQKDADDVTAAGHIDYDLNARSGMIGKFSTSVVSGERLFLTAESGEIFTDTLVSGRHIVFARDGSFTYCDLAEPHFHFTTKSMKFISQNVMVARPGVLYIGEVPVFWIPFFFQDVRSGRRSGLLTPNFGIAELLRNSPSYRRQISNMGYFFALSDYMDAELSFDWRSSARSTLADPGFVRTNAKYEYRWLSRFLNGRMEVSQLQQGNGRSNTSVTWNHSQEFSKVSRLSANLNWTKDTYVHQATTVNPLVATGTILSQANYQTKIGPASLNVGGSRRQYPGRSQVEMDFPNLSVNTGPLSAGPVTWTPGFRMSVSSAQHLDQGMQFPFVFRAKPDGGIDSVRVNGNRRTMNAGFDTPIKIYDFVWQNSFTINDQLSDFPEQRLVQNVHNPADSATRVFARTFQTSIDWNTSFSLPGFFRGSWNVAPSISFSNVDQGGLRVRTERSGGRWVDQAKRYSFSIGTSPTLYAIVPGLGPIAKFRHSISPTLSYTYSPAANVSDDFLAALGRTRKGYLGSLANNRVSLGLSTNLEAKLRPPADSEPESGKKVKLLSMQFSSLSWDFIRADTASTGLVENNFSISARTDLLPGLDFHTNYSLFQGDPLSDTATFKPFRQDVGVTFSLDGKSGILALVGRLFGRRGNLDDAANPQDPNRANSQDVIARQASQMGVAGAGTRGIGMAIPSGGGWRLNIQYNANRQRPPRGGTQILNDPTTLCQGQLALGQFVYDQCVLNAQLAPPNTNTGRTSIGAPTFISPPTQNIVSSMNFNITPNWSTQWSTQYDVTRSRFASQQVGLQRQLHDWNATFSFMQSPNGAFSFSFFIALKAQPDLKFDYNRSTYRSGTGF